MPYSGGVVGKLCGRLEVKLGPGENPSTLEMWVEVKAGALNSEWTSDRALRTLWCLVLILEKERKGTRETTTLSN